MALIFAKDVFLISLFFVSVFLGTRAEMGTEETHGSWKTSHNIPQLSLNGAEAGNVFYKIHSYIREKMLCGFVLFVVFYFHIRNK